MDKQKKTNPRPVIGITGPDKGGAIPWFFASLAVRMAGGKALRITPSNPRPIEDVDGLIIGGGADVDPTLYMEEDDENLVPPLEEEDKTLKGIVIYLFSLIFYPVLYLLRKMFSLKAALPLDRARDHLERKLLDRAIVKKLPVLGICRGAQLLNVYFGGTLYQNIKGFYIETPQVRSIRPRKIVHILPESRLAGILQTTKCRVNALHNQAIKSPGKDLRIVAREASQVVQAVEHASLPFVIGVQWHPEYLPQVRRQRGIFKILVSIAKELPEITTLKEEKNDETKTQYDDSVSDIGDNDADRLQAGVGHGN